MKLALKVGDSLVKAPFAASIQDFFHASFFAPSHFPTEPFSYSLSSSTPLFELIRNEESCYAIPSQPLFLINLLTHTHTQSAVALHSPMYSLMNVLFVAISCLTDG